MFVKKKNKKIIIIGGGIVGCALSFILSKNGHDIEIYDYKKKLGGVLGDFEEGKLKFFRGCQYINTNGLTDEFVKHFSKKIKIINHSYSSYTNFLGQEFFSNKYAVPVFKKNNFQLKKIKYEKKIIREYSLTDRINLYPNNIRNNLNNFFKNLNLNPKNISYKSYLNFQIGRVAFPEIEEQLVQLKKEFLFYDEIYAVDKEILFLKNFAKAILPKNGYDEFFKEFEKKSIKYNIKIFKSSNIKPIWKNRKLEIFIKNKKIDNDYIMWTGNPVILINNYLNSKLESLSFKVLQISANLKTNYIKENYIQVYSDTLDIIRIFLYNFNNISKINIETCNNKNEIDEKKILQETKKILEKLGILIDYDIATISSFRDIRFNIISVKDTKTIAKFIKKTKNTNLINSPWLEYGREQKLNYFTEQLKSLKLIS